MDFESKHYSKGMTVSTVFKGDSEDKEEHATAGIQKYAASILEPTFVKMSEISVSAMNNGAPEVLAEVSESSGSRQWKDISSVPLEPGPVSQKVFARATTSAAINELTLDAGDSAADVSRQLIQHSPFKVNEYIPWAPFANSHKSKRFEVQN
jgi:hypothetical protein